jgi:hypothetical protein
MMEKEKGSGMLELYSELIWPSSQGDITFRHCESYKFYSNLIGLQKNLKASKTLESAVNFW